MTTYLSFIGMVNALGAALLLACFSDRVADVVLRRGAYIIAGDAPVTHTPHSRVWLAWATIGAVVFAGWNLAARAWPADIARTIVLGDAVAYGLFWVFAVVGTIARRRAGSGVGPGILAGHLLWPAQGGWGAWVWATT